MGVFYGGIAHVPLSALVLVCELAGNYDLLVPLMLAQGIAFVALRKRTLYEAQVSTLHDSPVHKEAVLLDLLKEFRVEELMLKDRAYGVLTPATPASEMQRQVHESTWQHVFPVVNTAAEVIGIVSAETMRMLAADQEDTAWLVAADIMAPAVAIGPLDNLRLATERMVASGLKELPVVNEQRHIVGFLDETAIAQTYLRAALRNDSETAAEHEDDLAALPTPKLVTTPSKSSPK
jgi:CIC family chloride channel protein